MVVIAVEGKTDVIFFRDLLQYINIDKKLYEFKNFEGKDNIFNLLHKHYKIIEDEQDIIDGLLIAVDADDPKDSCPIRGYKATEEKLKEIIDNLDYSIDIDYFIFSDEEKKRGFLESFLLSVLDDEQKECLNRFRECFFEDTISDKWVYNSFYKDKKYPFDFSHPNFSELKQKLINLFEGINNDNTTSN